MPEKSKISSNYQTPGKLFMSFSQLTFAFSAAVNHLSGPLRKQNFANTGSKGHGF